jgi:restriction endonuclease S subunit
MLKINGKAAVVLPDGQDLFSKTNKTLVAVREYLMKTCDLKEIIYLPSGIFTYTSIKTCVFYFVKKREGSDVLETTIKSSKTQKENGRTYKFSKTHQTSKVAFYDFNPYEDVKNLLVEVPIDKIISNSYGLNYAEYMKDESVEDKYEEDVVVKTLGEVCEFQNGSQLDKKYMVEGNIPIFGGGVKIVGFHNENNRNGNETIVCGTGYPGYVNFNYGKPFWASQCFTMKSKNIHIMTDKFLYYYSKIVLENEFMSKQKGTAQKFIRFNQITDVKIPIPSLEKQQTIVAYLDYIYEKANKTSLTKIEELKQLNEFCLNNQKLFGEYSVKTLGEVCEVNPENMKSGQYTEINYIDIASVKGGQILELQKLTSDFPSRAKRIVKKGDILYSSVRPNLKGYLYISDNIQNGIASTGFANIRVKEPTTILSKYVYYIMTSDYISDDLINKAKGAQYPAVSFDDFETIKIPVPSLEKQKEIVAYCDYNTNLIKQLENEIENNKVLAEQFIKGIVKNVGIDNVEEETEEHEE